MEVRASARFVRMSPRKVRLVIDVVRGMGVTEARTQLRFMKKAAAEPVMKLINSAVANAINNHGLDESTLKVSQIFADGGPIMYRWRARAMGRAGRIRKRTSHITVVLEGEPLKKAAPKKETKVTKGDQKKSEETKKAETKTTKKTAEKKSEKATK